MSVSLSLFDAFVVAKRPFICVEIDMALGSTPRDADAFMLVNFDSILGTIGGGQLEYMAIDHARKMLREGRSVSQQDVPLGPEIGQCCGGRVVLDFVAGDAARTDALREKLISATNDLPHIYIFGAGHVGVALAKAVAALPFRVHLVDERPTELAHTPADVQAVHSVLPEKIVQNAPARSVFVILTHDHALDFMITQDALMRGDAAYVGMIGSRTKRQKFAAFLRENGAQSEMLSALHCPIGKSGDEKIVQDKRPEVIAALAAAEILVHTMNARVGGKNHEGSLKRKLGIS